MKPSLVLGFALSLWSSVAWAQSNRHSDSRYDPWGPQQRETQRLETLRSKHDYLVAIQRKAFEAEQLRAARKAAKLANQRAARALQITYRQPYKPPVVVSSHSGIQWIEPLRDEQFGFYRRYLDQQIEMLKATHSDDEQQLLLHGINQACRDLITAIERRKYELPANSYDSSRRFVNRILADMQNYDSVLGLAGG